VKWQESVDMPKLGVSTLSQFGRFYNYSLFYDTTRFIQSMDYQRSLKILNPGHEFFIGIDSDGCVFDSLEVKQKEFFIPNALKYFDLYAISKIFRLSRTLNQP
jgi:hypothetical protein